jgi:hypothetical protein
MGFESAIDQLRPDLTAIQIEKAEAALAVFDQRILPFTIGASVAALFLWTLILLELLPRGRD